MKNVIFFISFLFSLSISAQSLPKDLDKINRLLEKAIQDDKARNARVKAYLKNSGESRMNVSEQGQELFIYDIVDGKPTYLITHNEASVISLGADAVREGGGLGLNLTGENSRVAIWDSGISRDSHQEFEGRLKNNDSGADFSNHSTHVMGTLLAGGIDSKAKGFIPGATAKAFDFNDDTQEILLELRDNDILISNHSYGVPGGWVNGSWRGDRSISEEEDYRFGFYSSRSASIDNVAHSAPYYSIVKSAGNDRGDSGDGTHPPDGPFDCIGDFGVSKNVFTIGAVNKIPSGYTGPEDVVMSSFSGWGPVDDGRIKPDFVAPGVSLFSSIAGSDDSYGNLSGTSMAAPSATGGLTLINEAYHLFNGIFLRSATLKALAIHTINEAGNADGPDYQFGWGLLNVKGAVEHIIEQDGVNKIILEDAISNGSEYAIEINPVAGKPITVTLAWTDPAGSPVGASLDPTDLMLVNDLDMRIIDDIGNEVMPYILDPAIPGKAATRGDNFRDNIEKIYFPNPEGRKYTINISHKGTLSGSTQAFGLVVSLESEDPGIANLYWINDNGNWDDNSKWSFSSGGSPSDAIPSIDTKLIFDDNSFSGEEGTVVMNRDFTVAAVAALNNKKIIFDLGGNTLTVKGSIIVSSENFIIKNGSIVYLNEDVSKSFNVNLSKTETENVHVIAGEGNAATWAMEMNDVTLSTIDHSHGVLRILNSNLSTETFFIGGGGACDFSIMNSTIRNIDDGMITSQVNYVDDASSTYGFQGSMIVESQDLNASLIVNGNATLAGNSNYNVIQVETGDLLIGEEMTMDKLILEAGTSLRVSPDITYNVASEIELNATTESPISISRDGTGSSAMNIITHKKFCFENVMVDGVDLTGSSSIALGENAQITDASGWAAVACEDLLFANFNAEAACVGGILYLSDASDGKIDNYSWKVGDEGIGEASQAFYYIQDESPFSVTLTVGNLDGQESEWSQTITPITSEIGDNDIVQNSTQLASRLPGESYQWFKNGALLDGETGRTYGYDPEESAFYFVVIFEGGCNKRSEILDLTTSVINLGEEQGPVDVYPIPFEEVLNLSLKENVDNNISLKIYNGLGMLILSENLRLRNGSHSINTHEWNAGVYFGVMEIEDKIYSIKLIKR